MEDLIGQKSEPFMNLRIPHSNILWICFNSFQFFGIFEYKS